MQGVRLKPRGGGGTLKETGATKERYEVINFYQTPPSAELTLDEFEMFALDRLMVLRKIEDARARGFKWRELKDHIAGALRQYMRVNSLSTNVEAEIRKDLVSHFILRLAYCRTEDLRRWFITQECALFRFRLEELTPVGMASFIRKNGLMLETISSDEKDSKKSFLLSIPGASMLDFERTTYFKIPFTQVGGSSSYVLNRCYTLHSNLSITKPFLTWKHYPLIFRPQILLLQGRCTSLVG